jgi:hypothetical protein
VHHREALGDVQPDAKTAGSARGGIHLAEHVEDAPHRFG